MRFKQFSPLLVLLVMLVLVGSVSVLTPKASGNGQLTLTFTSRVESASCVNVGTVTYLGVTHPFPHTRGATRLPTYFSANPPDGCSFVQWEIVVSDEDLEIEYPDRQTTRMAGAGIVRAVFRGDCCSRYVGGVVTPTNPLTVLAPYLVIIGLVAAGTAAYVTKRKH